MFRAAILSPELERFIVSNRLAHLKEPVTAVLLALLARPGRMRERGAMRADGFGVPPGRPVVRSLDALFG